MRRRDRHATRLISALAAIALASASHAAHAAKSKGVITVVPVGGAVMAREVSAELEKKGFQVERGGSLTEPPSPLPVPVEQGRACVAEGHALAFRLDFAGAIRVLTECEDRLGPALARGEGTPVLSALLVELAAAANAAGERDRARATFVRLARIGRATPPDPSVHPPDVIARWEEVRRSPEPTRPVLVEATPPWAQVWIDGRPVEPGSRIPLAVGPHYAIADAAGFAPWAGTLVLEPGSSKLSARLVPLEREERAQSIRARAGWSIRADDAGIADPLTDVFGGPVLLVGATQAMLLLPGDVSRGRRDGRREIQCRGRRRRDGDRERCRPEARREGPGRTRGRRRSRPPRPLHRRRRGAGRDRGGRGGGDAAGKRTNSEREGWDGHLGSVNGSFVRSR